MSSEEMSALAQAPEHDTTSIESSNDVNVTLDDVNDASDDVDTEKLHASKKRFFIGLTIVLLIAVTWVGSTQSGKETYTSHFNAPYFTIWFSTSWMMFTYPVCVPLYLWLHGNDLSGLWRRSTLVFSEKGVTFRSLATSTLPFTLIWEATNYMYLRALGTIPPTDVTALFSSAPAFVYILSFFILREPLLVLRVFSVILAISGIILFAYSDGFGSASLLGISLAVLSAMGAALYKVCLKKRVGDADLFQMSLFLSFLGLFNLLTFWLIVITLHFTGVEELKFHYIPWLPLCISALTSFAFNFLINFGIAFTFPLFISIGTILGIPLNAVVDVVIRNINFLNWKITAATLIIGGFLLMLAPSSDSLFLHKKATITLSYLYKKTNLQSRYTKLTN